MRLYNYFRSSASYRVRIALNLKGITYEYVPVHLTRGGGEQFRSEFTGRNPAALVPVLEDGPLRLSQSLAIMEYLDERHPEPPLLPRGSVEDRAYVRQLAHAIACDIHPLNNLRVLKYLNSALEVSETQKKEWIRHWIALGFAALEAELLRSPRTSRFCFGDAPGLAECCLVPQLYNAARFEVDLSACPRLKSIQSECLKMEAFNRAHPSEQPDVE